MLLSSLNLPYDHLPKYTKAVHIGKIGDMKNIPLKCILASVLVSVWKRIFRPLLSLQYLNSEGMDLNWARANLRKKEKNYLLTMTRIIKQPCNISESFIFVRENILKSDSIYLLRRDQRCYVYLFMFFSTGQVIQNTWAVPDDRQPNT